jgi:hypothetical protein
MPDVLFDKPILAGGRKFSVKELHDTQETVSLFCNLSRYELALTVCEHLRWTSPTGKLKAESCLVALEKLEGLGYWKLPEKKAQKMSKVKTYESYIKDLPHQILTGGLESVFPLKLELVKTKPQRDIWNGYVEKYHYLGYKQPFASHLRYFVKSEKLGDQYLGCLLFAPSANALKCRDDWIGWSKKHRIKGSNLIICNSRFLIFPWIQIESLASKSLSLVANRVADDWQQAYGYRPVLLETFVDPEYFEGTCYKASNWCDIGLTAGRGRSSNQVSTNQKKVFVYPLRYDFRHILRNEKKSELASRRSKQIDFVGIWKEISGIIQDVAFKHDKTWQKRKRIIDTLMIMILIFRVVLSKNSQGYGSTILEFWDNCYKVNLGLPQHRAISASAFCEARSKVDEAVFAELNSRIIEEYEKHSDFTWRGHRLFAVDGTTALLPRSMLAEGYKPQRSGYYPKGMVSTLYQLKSKIPYDFNLSKNEGERGRALRHFDVLKRDDVVVYDRGYFSFMMLFEHAKKGFHGIFRLRTDSGLNEIMRFIKSGETDKIVTVSAYPALKKTHPDIDFPEIKLRLIKYTYDKTDFYVATTLLSETYSLQEISDLYHARWGVEELYKVSKRIIQVDDFHARSERGIRQELFAHYALITLGRIIANHSDESFFTGNKNTSSSKVRPLHSLFKSNFKNCLATLSRFLEITIFKTGAEFEKCTLKLIDTVARLKQKTRPGRKYERKSMKPESRWRRCFPSAASSQPKQQTRPLSIGMPADHLMELLNITI